MKILEPTGKTLAALNENDRLTAGQIAKMLGITYPTARRIIEANFEAQRFGAGKTTPFYVRAADFAAWLASKGIEPESVGIPTRKARAAKTPKASTMEKPKRIRRAPNPQIVTPTPAVEPAVETTPAPAADYETEVGKQYRALKQQVKAELEADPSFKGAPQFAQNILFENAFAVALRKAKLK